jgi:hypothetical protein
MEPLKFNKNQLVNAIDINQEEYYLKITKAEIKDFQALKSYHLTVKISLPNNTPLENILVDSNKISNDGKYLLIGL